MSRKFISIIITLSFLIESTCPVHLPSAAWARSNALRPMSVMYSGDISVNGADQSERPKRMDIVQKLMDKFKIGTGLDRAERLKLVEKLAMEYLTAIVTQAELRDLLKRFAQSKKPIAKLEHFLQVEILGYFLENTTQILAEVKNGIPFEKEKVHELFMAGIRVYKFPLVRGRIKKRKLLLYNFLLLNIWPPEIVRIVGSPIRSKEARELMIDEVFSSDKKTIFQPALEVMIELFASRKYSHHYINALLPVLKESSKLPRFAKALVDVLVKARCGRVQLFMIESKQDFLNEVKRLIKLFADSSEKLSQEFLFYLSDLAKKHEQEIPLAEEMIALIRLVEENRHGVDTLSPQLLSEILQSA